MTTTAPVPVTTTRTDSIRYGGLIVLMLMGFAAYFQLGQDEDPPFTFRVMLVQAYWPGATAEQIADQVTDKIEQWFEDTDVDGLNVAFAISPGDFEDIADMLVPELVKRGRYKREYAKGTLREKLFGAGRAKLDDAHPASRYRVKRGAAAE